MLLGPENLHDSFTKISILLSKKASPADGLKASSFVLQPHYQILVWEITDTSKAIMNATFNIHRDRAVTHPLSAWHCFLSFPSHQDKLKEKKGVSTL